jgi:hypothetical protein
MSPQTAQTIKDLHHAEVQRAKLMGIQQARREVQNVLKYHYRQTTNPEVRNVLVTVSRELGLQ